MNSMEQVSELIALTDDLLERKDQGESFSKEDLGTFGGSIKEMLEEAWPDISWASSHPRGKDLFGAEVNTVLYRNTIDTYFLCI